MVVTGPTPTATSTSVSTESAAPAGTALRPRRADAQRNRDRLTDVATAAFTESGVDVALEEIARRADVGIGTLYRNFPTREDLVLAVYRKQIDGLREAAIELPQQHEPGEALRLWMRGFVEYGAVKRGLVALLKSMMESQGNVFDEARAILRESAGALLGAAEKAGDIRTGFQPEDVIRALGGICMATDRPDAGGAALSLVDLVFDGLRFGAPSQP